MTRSRPGNGAYFLSYSSGDDDTVRKLRTALAELGVTVSVGSRDFRDDDPLEPTIHSALRDCVGVLILLHPRAHGSA
jgi:hypothetical protein